MKLLLAFALMSLTLAGCSALGGSTAEQIDSLHAVVNAGFSAAKNTEEGGEGSPWKTGGQAAGVAAVGIALAKWRLDLLKTPPPA